MVDAWKLDWHKLDAYIKYIREVDGYLFDIVDRAPINEDAINELLIAGWKVDLDDLTLRYLGLCKKEKKKICLKKSLVGYDRDKTLFHEIMHAQYGDVLNDGFIVPNEVAYKNNAIADWYARKLRANPELLRHTIDAFGLKGNIYDGPSYEAFSCTDLDRQLAFPFAQSHYHRLKETVFMD